MVEPLILAAGAAVGLIPVLDSITDWWYRTHGKDPWGRDMSRIRARDIEVGHRLIAYQDGKQLFYVDNGPVITRKEPYALAEDNSPQVLLYATDTPDEAGHGTDDHAFVVRLDDLVAVS